MGHHLRGDCGRVTLGGLVYDGDLNNRSAPRGTLSNESAVDLPRVQKCSRGRKIGGKGKTPRADNLVLAREREEKCEIDEDGGEKFAPHDFTLHNNKNIMII